MKCFIRAAEVWRPNQDHSALAFGAGLFGDAKSFAATSRAMGFARTVGLPGTAWERGHPVLLKAFEGTGFRRTVAARLAGLTCAVAMPFFVAGRLTAVLVLFGSDDKACTGAIELWRNDPRISGDMTLVEAYYGGMPAEFEALSRDTYLPRGQGLPGMAWQRDEAVILSRLDETTRFLRGDAVGDAGICRGLALPCTAMDHASHVLTLLSGQDTPIARRMERWVLDRRTETVTMAHGHCEVEGALARGVVQMPLVQASEAITQVLAQGAPAVDESLEEMAAPVAAAARACHAHGCVWVPVFVEDKVAELLALYL